MSKTDLGMFGLIRNVAEDRFDAQPAREAEAIGELLREFARRSDDLDRDSAMEWFQESHPWLFKAVSELPADVLADGIDHPEVLRPSVELIAKTVDEHRSGTLWDDLGFSLQYEQHSKQLYAKQDWKFLQELGGEVRYALPTSAWRDIIDGFEGRRVNDDVVTLLEQLGVASPDVRTASSGWLWSRDDELIHIRPQDAALFMDSLLLRRRGALLHQDPSWSFVRRFEMAGAPANCFVMPVEAYLGMRGIAGRVEELERQPDRARVPKSQLIFEATRQRLLDRGVEDPTPALVRRDGKECIVLPTDQARVLLKPADPSQARLTRQRLEYDPKAPDYDAGVSNICLQAAKLAYEKEADVKTFAKAWGWDAAELLDVSKHPELTQNDAQMMIACDLDKNTIILAPRGSESRTDMLADADAFRVPAADLFGKGEVASGFLEQFKSLLPLFEPQFEAYRKKLSEHRRTNGLPEEAPRILIGGHSLGGSLATLFMTYLLNKGVPVHHVYTYGQPLTGNEAFCRHSAELAFRNKTVVIRYMNGGDPVVHVPMNCQNKPLGFQIYIDEFGRMCPQNKPMPPDAAPPPDGIMALIKRGLNKLSDGANDHRMDSYFVLLTKSLKEFACSVWS